MKSTQFLALVTLLFANAFALAPVKCNSNFSPITASDWVKRSSPGWNLGNTLNAVPTEGAWNNPPVVPGTFDDIKKAGFKGVRLPVTWTTKIGPAPSYTVDAVWLNRVATVLDQITSRGLYAIVNVHHDSWEWFDFSAPGANIPELEAKFSKLWQQIAVKLACTNSLVAFEPINEPKGTTKQHADVLNKMNEVFLKAINEAGGFNPQRVVTLVGLGEDSIKTSQWFKKPTGSWKNPWALQYHYYSPYDFIFSAWGKTTWGSKADLDTLDTDLRLLRQNFTGIPLVLGEYAASPASTEPAARWKWFDAVMRTSAKYDMAHFLWDNGGDFFDRGSRTWRDETALEIVTGAAKRGVRNSLADSVEDAREAVQWSSAYVFHKSGEQVVERSLRFLLNGNTIKAVTGVMGPLETPSDYRVLPATADGKANITFTKEFLGKRVSPYALPGIKANLTVHFSAGASAHISIVQWDLPTVKGAKSSKAVAGKDLEIPITWKGLAKVAAVKAVFKDGVYLADDWTKYLGPLQAGYATYNNHWNFNANNIVLKQGAVEAVIKARKAAVFTFEFWPRVPGNAFNYTLNV